MKVSQLSGIAINWVNDIALVQKNLASIKAEHQKVLLQLERDERIASAAQKQLQNQLSTYILRWLGIEGHVLAAKNDDGEEYKIIAEKWADGMLSGQQFTSKGRPSSWWTSVIPYPLWKEGDKCTGRRSYIDLGQYDPQKTYRTSAYVDPVGTWIPYSAGDKVPAVVAAIKFIDKTEQWGVRRRTDDASWPSDKVAFYMKARR